MAKEKTATIKFDKEKHGGVVRGAVNGARYEFPVGEEVTVNEAQLASLQDSGATFEVVESLGGGDEEGSASSSTLTGTATRLGEPTDGEGEGEPDETKELSQRTDEELATASQEASKEQAGKKAKAKK